MVEFAIVASLLLLLVFGIIEFGLIIKDYLTVNQAAREGARCAALRSTPDQVVGRVQASAAGFTSEEQAKIAVACYYREFQNGWGNWQPGLPDPAADMEAQVKVEATYPHPTVIGSLFGLGESVSLPGNMVMRRE